MNYYKQTEKQLKNYNMLKVNIENLKSEIEEIEKEDGMSGISYNMEKISETFKISSATENTAIENITSIELKKKLIEKIQNKLDRIDRAVEKLSDIHKHIINSYYFENLPWYVIAYKLRYSERHCRRLRNEAIEKLIIGIYGDI